MIRVAFIHYTCPPVVGGVEQVIAAHARLFLDAGYDIRLVVGRGGPVNRRAQLVCIPELDSRHPAIMDTGEELAAGHVPASFARYRESIAEKVRQVLVDVDICIVHNAFTLHKNLPLTAALHNLAAEPSGPRWVAWCHDLAWANPQYLPVLHKGYPWDLLWTPHPHVRYVCVSEERRHELQQAWPVDAPEPVVIPNGVDIPGFLRLGPRARRLAAALRLFERDLILLLPARLTRRKNIELALRVVAALHHLGVAAALLVTGPAGPHNPQNESYVRELTTLRDSLGLKGAVHFLSIDPDRYGRRRMVDDATLADLYTMSDALLLPSSQEGFGIPLLEAGLARLPIFCSDIPPLRVLGQGSASFFALDDPPEAIAQRILDTLNHTPSFLMSRRVRQHYSWSAIYTAMIAPFIQRILEEKTP
jgi:glycosyltransferase involved in cell wall biosynthesis